MTAMVRGELIKTVTTRTALGYAALGAALSAIGVVILTLSQDLATTSDKELAIGGAPIVLLLFGLVGAAGEYRHRTAAPAALVTKDRGKLLMARAGSYALVSAGIAVVMFAVALALALPLLAGEPGPSLSAADIAWVGGGSIVAALLSAIMGVGAGALARNQVLGVVTALVLGFIVTPLIEQIDPEIATYTPFGAANTLAGNGDAIGQGLAGLVFLAWTLPIVAAAVVAERRRDLA